jgi:rhodanese-related sulfurtransferase
MSIKPEDLLDRIDAGRSPVILDVRSQREFASGHVPSAVHFPFRRASDRTVAVPAAPDDEIVIYCGHGPRAWIAAAALRRRGFSRVTYLKGHMHGWKKRGLREEF